LINNNGKDTKKGGLKMWRKIMAWIMVVTLCMVMIGCGSSKTIDGVTYDTYGILNINKKADNIKYETITGNVIWSVLLFETIVAPVYFLGFSLYEPIEKKL